MIRKLWPRLSSHAVKPPSKQERCEQLGMRTRPATYVGGFFSREELSSVIDGGG